MIPDSCRFSPERLIVSGINGTSHTVSVDEQPCDQAQLNSRREPVLQQSRRLLALQADVARPSGASSYLVLA